MWNEGNIQLLIIFIMEPKSDNCVLPEQHSQALSLRSSHVFSAAFMASLILLFRY